MPENPRILILMTDPSNPAAHAQSFNLKKYVLHGKTLENIGTGKDILDKILKDLETEVKINKWDFLTLKNFCMAKETFNKVKRQPTK